MEPLALGRTQIVNRVAPVIDLNDTRVAQLSGGRVMRTSCFYRSVLLFFALLGVNTPANADLITQIDVGVSGAYDYLYTITNESTSDAALTAFALNVSSEANLRSLSGPIGWDIGYSPGDVVATWVASDLSTLILPGGSAVFGYSSDLGPGLQSYSVVGLNLTTFELAFSEGQVLGASSPTIPEPAIFTLVGIAVLAGLPRFCRLRRSRVSPRA